MENYSLLMGAAVMKMAVEMAAVSMEKPSGHSPLGGVPAGTLSPDLGLAMAAALEGPSSDVPSSSSDESSFADEFSSSRPVRQRHAPDRYSPSQYGLSVASEPTSYRDVERHPEWQLAMAEEIAALERTGTWNLVSPPTSVRPITCKWIYKIKTLSDGSLERYNARLVARGFQQEHGRDYDETFAPVAHMTTVRTLLCAFDDAVSQLNVQNTFLNGELSEEVYMQPPPGYSVPNGMVCRLRCSLYGLKQAPRAWFERFASVVTTAGFSPSAHDQALFVHTSPRGRTLLLLYVDDMIITADDLEYIHFVKSRLRDKFLMTDLGPFHYFLGIEVSSTSDGFSISQEKYIQDLLTRAALGDERTAETPMELNVKLHPTNEPCRKKPSEKDKGTDVVASGVGRVQCADGGTSHIQVPSSEMRSKREIVVRERVVWENSGPAQYPTLTHTSYTMGDGDAGSTAWPLWSVIENGADDPDDATRAGQDM
ncbi:hypothetical protein QYE76_005330 [Lolium multiflorum]|uniref:Reverse transcriptase Ty1/copia-type domain-containing protein n=1 Tax=Lolium multiflorum TaxID=4521 RepID=A0AAD8RTQ3_LOLMU|nr:hypothetical protein QYE76_005330 [Lolium multiflorum]